VAVATDPFPQVSHCCIRPLVVTWNARSSASFPYTVNVQNSSLICNATTCRAASINPLSLLLVVGLVRFGDEGIFIADKSAGMLVPCALQAFSDVVLNGPMNLALTMV